MAEGFITRRGTPVVEPPGPFIDTSGSPGNTEPILDLDGNLMADEDKGIAYYGTVSHTDLFTGEQLASEIGLTNGSSINNEEVWHKYYWNGGIHFWRKPCRNNSTWNDIWSRNAVFGTGTSTSRKGFTPANFNGPNLTGINQNREVIKNNITYAVRLLEGSSDDPSSLESGLHGSEFNLILMNLHAATNSGSYSDSPTDGVSYANWTHTANFTNDDFVGWKTDLGDSDFLLNGTQWQQEGIDGFPERRLNRARNVLSAAGELNADSRSAARVWAPVLTVKAEGFSYE
jgi:hypothetical protein